MLFGTLAVISSLPLLAFGARFKRATPESFGLYAYGDGLGGIPLFYSGGFAYIGEPGKLNSTDAAVVQFSLGDDNSWIGSPNVTIPAGSNVTWSNATFFVPADGASDTRVGFETGTTISDNVTATGFVFYGNNAMRTQDGQLVSLWSALQVSDRVHALYWNDTSQGQQPVMLRSLPPSNPDN
ncbi:hypothetical protein BU24DRAFT_449625 [Aaosphaeria arxii CBS 175.79]|uniref:Concanavalin A-like lectin/glucanase n=1 Tax=Aaosphaeria arxii CBS 175.79 TaxID=1450172 RepID=A0A6A5XYX4_9PLEO|nr:uncharacterized protein BU24DRAFT_449625 [Aaosphaeria arxii CBS 175.79]KAF2018093.1 hypothetical protein BU24DRAFT_449625 [Aaosphaeria arxii CBS 175.79]